MAWNAFGTRADKLIQVAMYILTPHNFVIL
eukprot:COSAG02_NODE_51059_length_316_cov_1.184332_1_plen_29_part_01